jgi:hypothetical protein
MYLLCLHCTGSVRCTPCLRKKYNLSNWPSLYECGIMHACDKHCWPKLLSQNIPSLSQTRERPWSLPKPPFVGHRFSDHPTNPITNSRGGELSRYGFLWWQFPEVLLSVTRAWSSIIYMHPDLSQNFPKISLCATSMNNTRAPHCSKCCKWIWMSCLHKNRTRTTQNDIEGGGLKVISRGNLSC